MSDFVTISDPPANLLRQASLFLDLDGTVLELADSPHGVRVGPDLVDLLELAQQKLSGRLAVISGRSAVDVAGLFPSLNLNIAGSHGLEIRWADGRRNAPVRGPAVDEALATMQRFADPRQGLLVEDKPFGVALHYRLAPQLERECQALAEQLARDTGLILQTGKMVAELKTSAAHKGDALDLFMNDPVMHGGAPVFIGDDNTDEPAFVAAGARGGAGILVGKPRATAAGWRLESVSHTLAWLRTGLGVVQ